MTRFFNIVFQRETRPVVLALGFASAVSVTLLVARMIWAFKAGYSFLAWNLFLAWIPLMLALIARDELKRRPPGIRLLLTGGAWLVFFPNAPYILTDLVHLKTRLPGNYWVDLVLILTCAITGLLTGLVSLFLMQSVVRRIAGAALSWVFVAVASGLSGLGVCIGRFLRFNSWDVLLQPLALSRGIKHWGIEAIFTPAQAALPVLFGLFLFTVYLMLYAVTHLPAPSEAAGESAEHSLRSATS